MMMMMMMMMTTTMMMEDSIRHQTASRRFYKVKCYSKTDLFSRLMMMMIMMTTFGDDNDINLIVYGNETIIKNEIIRR